MSEPRETARQIAEQWRQALYPHIDEATFFKFLPDTTVEGWDEMRKEVAALTSILATLTADLAQAQDEAQSHKDHLLIAVGERDKVEADLAQARQENERWRAWMEAGKKPMNEFQSCRCPARKGQDCPLTADQCSARVDAFRSAVAVVVQHIACDCPDTGEAVLHSAGCNAPLLNGIIATLQGPQP